MKILKKILEALTFLFGLDCKARRDAVDADLCDFSGQGRDTYGR